MSTTLVPLKRISDLNPETLGEDTDPNRVFRYIDIGTTGRGALLDAPQSMTFESAPSRARRVLQPGDTILSTVRTYLRAVWTVRERADDLVASTGFVCLRPHPDMDPRFLGWLAQSDVVVEEVVARSVGVSYPAINPSDVGLIKVPCPPLATQQLVADYLDRETARIDALIAAKQRIVELVEQRVRLLAHELTTRSTEPIPIRRLVRSIKTGTTPPADELRRLSEGGVPWYSPGDVGEWLELSEPSRTLKNQAVAEGWVPRFPSQSTLLVGIGATAGKVAFLKHAASGNQQMTCLEPSSRVLPRFLAWQLYARRDEIRATAPFTTLPIINNEFVKSLLLVVAPLAEQADVVSRLDTEASRAQALAQSVKSQTAILQERRQAIITAAVTGQLDIPEAA